MRVLGRGRFSLITVGVFCLCTHCGAGTTKTDNPEKIDASELEKYKASFQNPDNMVAFESDENGILEKKENNLTSENPEQNPTNNQNPELSRVGLTSETKPPLSEKKENIPQKPYFLPLDKTIWYAPIPGRVMVFTGDNVLSKLGVGLLGQSQLEDGRFRFTGGVTLDNKKLRYKKVHAFEPYAIKTREYYTDGTLCDYVYASPTLLLEEVQGKGWRYIGPAKELVMTAIPVPCPAGGIPASFPMDNFLEPFLTTPEKDILELRAKVGGKGMSGLLVTHFRKISHANLFEFLDTKGTWKPELFAESTQ